MKWYRITPLDTLFFKGSEPMVMGSDHTATLIFPPGPETIAGALRTAIIRSQGVSFDEYNFGNVSSDLIDRIGKSGQPAPFCVIGPLFMKKDRLFVPAPYSWYIDKKSYELVMANKDKGHTVTLQHVSQIKNSKVIIDGQYLTGWVKSGLQEITSAGGFWINVDDVGKNEVTLYPTDFFYARERRTGIALNDDRSVRVHHLYSFVHAPLKDDVSMVCGISKDIGIPEILHIRFGAEQRIARITSINSINIPQGRSNTFMALSIVEGNEKTNSILIAAGKPIYIGGWDMHRRFHKPMKGYYPAGSVFSEKILENMMEL